MRVATGLLMALYLLFMGYRFTLPYSTDYGGEVDIIRFITASLLVVQLISWCFSFTKPRITCAILIVVEALSIFLIFTFYAGFLIIAVPNLIFVFMSYAGYRELS